MYAEGPDFGYSNRTNDFWPYFGCSYLADGYAMTTGNVQSVTGQAGTFARGMNLGYLYQQWPDNYVDEISENGGRLYLRDQSGIGRGIFHSAESWRTVFSAVAFGALQAQGRGSLMKGYMNYLLYGLGISGPDRPGLSSGLRIRPNPSRGRIAISLPPTADRPAEIGVYDAAGRCVRVLAVSGERTAVSVWDGRGPDGRPVAAGIYFAQAAGRTEPFVVLSR